MDRGQTNDFTTNTSTSTQQIIKRNVLTLFNTLNFVIAVAFGWLYSLEQYDLFAVICSMPLQDHDRDARQADDW